MNNYDQVEWLRSNKGGAKIIHKWYMYTIHKKRYGKIRWRCAQRTLHCKGSITTGSGAPVINLPHNHIPDLQAVVQARSRTSQVPDDNDSECPADVIPIMSDNIYSYPDIYDYSMDQNTDHELNDHISPENNASSLQTQLVESNTCTMSSSNKTTPSESEMCLRWNTHHSNMQTVFPALLENERYVDVTLAADGQLIKCHKLVLSSCSEYFDEIFKDTYPMQHTVVYLRGIPFWIIKALVDFMYKGEVNIDQMKLEPLLKAAEDLQIKGLAGKAKVKNEPVDLPTIINPKPPKEVFEKKVSEPKSSKEVFEKKVSELKQPKENVEKPIKKEAEKDYGGLDDDDDDDDYTPNQYYKRKLQPKKIRKRKIATPPDPSALKHVKINLKGTKSRPNIKQPKFFDPDYPEYDPDRCVSPPKLDSNDPIFNINNIKMEPIDFEVPTSPTYSEISSLMDQSLSECASLEKLKTEKSKSFDEPKKIRKYAGKTKPNFSLDKQAVFQIACSSIDIPSTVLKKEIESDEKSIDVSNDSGQNKILFNVQNKSVDSNSSFKKVIDIKKPLNTSEVEKSAFSQIRVKSFPTTDHVLKKFASTHLTSILRKESMPAILRRVSTPKPAILRHSTPKKVDIVKTGRSEIAEKLSALAKTKKELISAEVTNAQAQIQAGSLKHPEVESQKVKHAGNSTDTTEEDN